MENNENLKVLKELHTGAQMGIKAISYVSEKVEDDNFKKELSTQYNQYEDILNKVTDLYNEYGEVPASSNVKNDVMTWMGVQMNTMNDRSTSKISEMLIQGTVMGIIEGRKILNHNPNVETNIKNTLNEFVQMQENSVTKLKEYL
ncbi:MAG: hypothetical protein HFJ24_08110 [Clostridia bacterium]|nr:hypothetical protein [Clostridia bacterium]MCI9275859.1 hypothetical protein [Clostridia bacterium]